MEIDSETLSSISKAIASGDYDIYMADFGHTVKVDNSKPNSPFFRLTFNIDKDTNDATLAYVENLMKCFSSKENVGKAMQTLPKDFIGEKILPFYNEFMENLKANNPHIYNFKH